MKANIIMIGFVLLFVAVSGNALCQTNSGGDEYSAAVVGISSADSTELKIVAALNREYDYARAEELGRQSLAKFEKEYGANSLEVAMALDQLVESLWKGGKASEEESKQFGTI